MIIGLSGYAQSGKDTVADYLMAEHGFIRRAFADNIRRMLYDVNPMIGHEPLQVKVDVDGWDKAKQDPIVRRMLQVLGVSARENIHQDVWINAALDRVLNDRIVITDVRFINEAEAIRNRGGEIWRVVRPGVNAVNSHVSETQLDNYKFDQYLVNDGSITDLHNQVLNLIGARL